MGDAFRPERDQGIPSWGQKPPGMFHRKLVAFTQDEEGDWRGHLDCGHRRHFRHEPPRETRPWVLTAEGRSGQLGSPVECGACARREPPEDLEFVRRTEDFTRTTLPTGLLQDHRLKPGHWGHLHLLQGRLEYHDQTGFTTVLEGGQSNWVQPELVHHIRPLDEVLLHIEFFRVRAALA